MLNENKELTIKRGSNKIRTSEFNKETISNNNENQFFSIRETGVLEVGLNNKQLLQNQVGEVLFLQKEKSQLQSNRDKARNLKKLRVNSQQDSPPFKSENMVKSRSTKNMSSNSTLESPNKEQD
jgi:hypothetical protein